ncbi:MAG: hypothetical protein ACUVXF_04955 [Desulfobaccales bacterium]
MEKEWQALVNSQEEAILALASRKEQILKDIIFLASSRQPSECLESEKQFLHRLKHEVATAQTRNHRLITTALETIQDFLAILNPPPPGIYQPCGKVEASPGNSLFHRQA